MRRHRPHPVSTVSAPAVGRHQLLLVALVLAMTAAGPVAAQTAQNVLVVTNANSPASMRIADRYAAARGVPDNQVLSLDLDMTETVARDVFVQQIERPIGRWLQEHGAQDRILYIVLIKDVPLRVTGTLGRTGTLSSVDSELTLLYRKLVGAPVAPGGRIPNPYFQADLTTDHEPARFSHEDQDIYLVTRLDGFSLDDVLSLIDRGTTPSTAGQIVLDQKADPRSPGDRWLSEAAQLISGIAPERVILETTTQAAVPGTLVLGYYSWGSNDPALLDRDLGLTFAAGAIASSYVGTSARTFTAPPDDWQIGTWQDRRTYYASSPEWLAGDLVRQGATGVVGHVADPYLDGAVRPGPLFAAYLMGFNLAEAVYAALPDLGWRAVVVGDPLAAPFPHAPLTADLAAPTADSATGLPRFFSTRRIDRLVAEGVDAAVARLLVRAETSMAADEQSEAKVLLEEALELGDLPRTAELSLAELYRTSGDVDNAIARYRAILERSPDDVSALNNLAYVLLSDESSFDEAFRLAQRAHALAPRSPAVADTLGWIHHLRGEDAQAARYLQSAVAGMADSADVRLHAAVVLHAVGQIEGARAELARALELDPELGGTSDVVTLRERLDQTPAGDRP